MKSFLIRVLFVSLALAAMCATVNGRFIHRIEDYNMPMNEFVAECRKGCLIKFLSRPLNGIFVDECSRQPNCFMCWDYCSMLYGERKKQLITKLMCTDDVCFAGCKFACNYLRYLLAKPMHRVDFFK